MPFVIKVAGYYGTQQFRQLSPGLLNGAISEAIQQPYNWLQILSISGSAISSAAINDINTNLIVIEVPDGSSIRYEFNTPNRVAVTAGNASPRLAGFQVFSWIPGTILSAIDATALP